MTFSIQNDYDYLKSLLDCGDIGSFAVDMKMLFGDQETLIPLYQYDRHEHFMDAQWVITQFDVLLSCFERMYKEGRWDRDYPWIIYDDDDGVEYDAEWLQELIAFFGGSESRGPSGDARSAYEIVQHVKKLVAQAAKDVFVYNEKWLVWTRAESAPDAYLQEAIEDGSVLACGPDDLMPQSIGGQTGILYVTGWDSFVYMFSHGQFEREFGDLIRLTDVHQRVADLLLAVQTKNREDGPIRYCVRVEWVDGSTCVKVGGMNTDAFRPKKRSKLERKCMRKVCLQIN